MFTPSAPQIHRSIALVLILLVLAGCWGPAKSLNPPASTPAAVKTASPAPTGVEPMPFATATPAPTPRPTLDTPIIWYLRGATPPDLPQVNEQLNRLLEARRFNARVELRVIERGLFEKHMAQIQAAGQPWDLVSLPMESYFTWNRRGDLLALYSATSGRDLLSTNAPELWASLPEATWKALSRPLPLAAVPNPAKGDYARGISIRADVVRALNLQPELDQVKTWSDLSPIFAKVQAADADKTLEARGVENAGKVGSVIGTADLLRPEAADYELLTMPFAVRFDDPNRQVVNWISTPEFKTLTSLLQDWRKAGLLPEEPLTPDEADEGYRNGRYLVEVGHLVGPGSALDQAERFGYEWIDIPIAHIYQANADLLGSTTGINKRISADQERVKRVLLMLEWLHTDPEIYNLLAYGIESQHWNWVDREKQVIQLQPASTYLPDFREQLGDSRLAYETDPHRVAAKETVDAIAPLTPVLGFYFDPQPVAGEVLSIKGLLPELIDPLANGQVKDVERAITRLNKALEDAGSKAIEAELTRQLQDWQAGR